jgi:hypothetical protein
MLTYEFLSQQVTAQQLSVFYMLLPILYHSFSLSHTLSLTLMGVTHSISTAVCHIYLEDIYISTGFTILYPVLGLRFILFGYDKIVLLSQHNTY